MGFKLVVTQEFHGYQKGQEITDPDVIAQVLAENEPRIVRVTVPDEPPGPQLLQAKPTR